MAVDKKRSENNLKHANIYLENGTPKSEDFDDFYFSTDDGFAESHYHFIQGNHLEQRFSEETCTPFTIVETGFGTGLNFLIAANLWKKLAPSDRCLNFISTEKHPILVSDLAAIYDHENWNNAFTQALLAQYPPPKTGHYCLEIAANIRLMLFWGDSVTQLSQCNYSADAFFLDGFSPNKNPEMWSEELFKIMQKTSKAGTTFATFTAASSVRKGLSAAGFTVKKESGFGKKRERLIGSYHLDHITTHYNI